MIWFTSSSAGRHGRIDANNVFWFCTTKVVVEVTIVHDSDTW